MYASSSPYFIVLNELVGNHPASLNALQSFLAPYVGGIASAWLALWCTVAVLVLWRLVREIKEERKK